MRPAFAVEAKEAGIALNHIVVISGVIAEQIGAIANAPEHAPGGTVRGTDALPTGANGPAGASRTVNPDIVRAALRVAVQAAQGAVDTSDRSRIDPIRLYVTGTYVRRVRPGVIGRIVANVVTRGVIASIALNVRDARSIDPRLPRRAVGSVGTGAGVRPARQQRRCSGHKPQKLR